MLNNTKFKQEGRFEMAYGQLSLFYGEDGAERYMRYTRYGRALVPTASSPRRAAAELESPM